MRRRYTEEDILRAFRRGQVQMRARCWREFRKTDFKDWPDFKTWASWLRLPNDPKPRRPAKPTEPERSP